MIAPKSTPTTIFGVWEGEQRPCCYSSRPDFGASNRRNGNINNKVAPMKTRVMRVAKAHKILQKPLNLYITLETYRSIEVLSDEAHQQRVDSKS
jgi:hypothetical protein